MGKINFPQVCTVLAYCVPVPDLHSPYAKCVQTVVSSHLIFHHCLQFTADCNNGKTFPMWQKSCVQNIVINGGGSGAETFELEEQYKIALNMYNVYLNLGTQCTVHGQLLSADHLK